MSASRRIDYRKRRAVFGFIATIGLIVAIILNPSSYRTVFERIGADGIVDALIDSQDGEPSPEAENLAPLGASSTIEETKAIDLLEQLAVKGRAPKTGYERTQFYDTWPLIDGCSLRQHIIKRELGDTAVISEKDNCSVVSGEFDEPYTGSHMIFYEKSDFSNNIQIDHVVALADAWQKGAQQLTKEERYELATDPLNLLAVESQANQNKSGSDAASWLPPNKKFRCAYVARQVSVKYKYHLWITEAEKAAIARVLDACPDEPALVSL